MVFISVFVRKTLAVAAVSRKSLIAAILMMALFLVGPLLYRIGTEKLPLDTGASVEGVFSDTIHRMGEREAMPSALEEIPVREVHIANNGLVLLRGARITSISGIMMQARVAWDSTDFVWLIETNVNTRFLTREGTEQALENIHVGDVVTITGTLTGSGTKPAIRAKFVRE